MRARSLSLSHSYKNSINIRIHVDVITALSIYADAASRLLICDIAFCSVPMEIESESRAYDTSSILKFAS